MKSKIKITLIILLLLLLIVSIFLVLTGKVNLRSLMGNTAQSEYVCEKGTLTIDNKCSYNTYTYSCSSADYYLYDETKGESYENNDSITLEEKHQMFCKEKVCSCDVGYTKENDTKCTKTTYSCPEGYSKTNDEKKCSKKVYQEKTPTQKYDIKNMGIDNKCPDGYNEVTIASAKKCRKVTYSCTSGYTLSSDKTKCVSNVATEETVNAKENVDEKALVCNQVEAVKKDGVKITEPKLITKSGTNTTNNNSNSNTNTNTGNNNNSNTNVSKPSKPTINVYSFVGAQFAANPTKVDKTKMMKLTSPYTTPDYIFIEVTGSGSGVKYYMTVTGVSANVKDLVTSYRNIKAKGKSTISVKACNSAGCSDSVSVTVERKQSISMLFVGNSKTRGACKLYNNNDNESIKRNVPTKVYGFMNNASISTSYKEAAICNKTLNFVLNYDASKKAQEDNPTVHPNNINTKALINDSYDYAILQEATAQVKDYETYKKHVNAVIKVLKNKNPNVKVFIRTSWSKSGSNIAIETMTKNTEKLAQELFGSEWSNRVIYDGKALKSSSINILESDNKHQNRHGSYLIAACIYKKITGLNPVGNKYTFNNLSDYKTMQTIANNNC